MRISCHIHFDGQCEEAFRTYQDVLGGRLETLLRFRDSPLGSQVPEEWQARILHATLVIGEYELLGSDVFPGQSGRKQGYSITLSLADPEDAESMFTALAAGGSIPMPLQPTFWAAAFGVVTDKYGVSWQVNCVGPNEVGPPRSSPSTRVQSGDQPVVPAASPLLN